MLTYGAVMFGPGPRHADWQLHPSLMNDLGALETHDEVMDATTCAPGNLGVKGGHQSLIAAWWLEFQGDPESLLQK